MLVKDTPENRALAAVAERSAKAATGLNLARRALLHGCGFGARMVGLAALLAGAGVFAQKAQEGYASIIGNQEIAERADRRTAALLAENREENREDLRAMLAAATIKTEVAVKGEVGLKDGGLVGLKSGQQVGLADGGQVSLAKGGMIGLSPDSTVRVEPYSTLRAIGQDAPRLAMLEPPATLRAIRNTAPAPPRKSAQAAPLTCKGTQQ
jgi:hypothetical protein